MLAGEVEDEDYCCAYLEAAEVDHRFHWLVVWQQVEVEERW